MSKIVFAAAAAAALLVAGQAAAAQRADERAPSAEAVKVGEVNFQSPAEVKAFYIRLARAARDVCDSGITDRSIRQADAACARESMDRAVAQLQRPLLSARHEVRANVAFARGY